jgi:hypothetical protein
MLKTIDDWQDERESVYLKHRAANDNDDSQTATIAANSNRRGAWIEYDDDGNAIRVVRGAQSVVRCAPFKVKAGAAPPVLATPATEARARLEQWRLDHPETDSKILPRKPRNVGGHALAEYSAELAWWRAMTNAPMAWDGVIHAVANDNFSEERENEEERPSVNELLASLPVRIRHAMSADIMPTDIRILTTDIEWRRGRIARLGGLRFATATRQVPDEETATSNAAGAVLDLPRAGALLRFKPQGRGWSRPTMHSRQKRGGANPSSRGYLSMLPAGVRRPRKVAKSRRRTDARKLEQWLATQDIHALDPSTGFRAWCRSQQFETAKHFGSGLPWQPRALSALFLSGRTVPGAGQKDGAGDYEHIRRQHDIGERAETRLGDAECLEAFRALHSTHTVALDAAMKAENMGDVAAAIGRASPHTGLAALRAACAALRSFRSEFGQPVQNLPTRAA